ncbi:unnamed protein product [Rotaria sordida]|uniref:Reverse transcriptase domain-containing protein n=1 Tax=Rotaria sordida TaxID=392033 RepID=A0A814XSU7_9BILA|nr:unnamed protein product [Rotaria sordida]CAF1499640.1 unnamed protein product [Rotaria sordida]
MFKELNERNILPLHQAGFRSHRNTMYNIIRLERYAREQLQKRQHSAVIFFDIKAAFDTVWFDGIIYKLFDLRLPDYLICYIISFLDNRTASIEIENILSKLILLKSGTPQGSPLSPLLYIIYTSDSMNSIHQHTEYGLFADDAALWTTSNTITNLNYRLQSSINEFQKWCSSWKLTIQPTKTELLYFSPHPRKKYRKKLEIEVEDIIIKPTSSARYLGVIFDHKLDWRTQVKHVETKVASRISLLRFLSKLNPNANLNTMLTLYKSLVRSVISYGSTILLTAKENIWKRLQTIQNKALKATLGFPIYTSTKYVHSVSNIQEIKAYSTTLFEQSITRARIYDDKITENNLLKIQLHIERSDI